jgi:two-component system phosphate regulon response regulator OmpR
LNPEQPKVIILDAAAEFRGMLRQYLCEHSFEVHAVATAEQLDRHLQRETYDTLVLDLMMPGEGGLALCRRIRAMGNTIPILMLTARGDPVDRIVGLETGADDYLSKPFDPRELTARLHAMFRRQRMLHNSTTWGNGEVTNFGPFKLNVSSMELTLAII